MERYESTPQDRNIDAALDTELSAVQETEFFEQLAGDAELRAALHASQAIRGAARAYPSSMTPPAELGARLFSGLGIDLYPPSVPAPPEPAARTPRLGRSGLITLAGAVLILGSLGWFYFCGTDTGSEHAKSSRNPAEPPAAIAPPSAVSEGMADGNRPEDDAGTRRPASSGERAPGKEIVPSPAMESSALSNKSGADATRSESAAGTGKADQSTRTSDVKSGKPTSDVSSPRTSPDDAVVNDAKTGDSAHDNSKGSKADRSSSASGDRKDGARQMPSISVPPGSAARGETDSKADPKHMVSTARSEAVDAADSDPAPSLLELSQPARIAASADAGSTVPDVLEPVNEQWLPMRRFSPVGTATDFSLRVRGYSTASAPAAGIGQKSSPLFENAGIAVLYALGDEHAIALEVGQEAFAQDYSGIEAGKSVRYQQNLLAPWLAGSYIYRPAWARLGSALTPVASLGAGVTRERWPMTRASLGLRYAPLPNIAAEAGIEGTLLAYPFQDKWFTTRKLGVTYGIIIAF